jgi:hypothetical protein
MEQQAKRFEETKRQLEVDNESEIKELEESNS